MAKSGKQAIKLETWNKFERGLEDFVKHLIPENLYKSLFGGSHSIVALKSFRFELFKIFCVNGRP